MLLTGVIQAWLHDLPRRLGIFAQRAVGPLDVRVLKLLPKSRSASAVQADENGQDVFARSPTAGVLSLPDTTAAKLA